MEDLYSATAEAENENKAPHWTDLSNSIDAQDGIEKLLALCADDAVTLLCTATSYLCRKYPKAYPEEATLLKKAVKRITPNRTSYMHISPKVSTSRALQHKDSLSPRGSEGKEERRQKQKSSNLNHLDKVVNHSALTEPKRKTKIGRPISYERTAAKASVSNELHEWAQDRKIKDWLRERRKKEEGRRRMTDFRHVSDVKWLEESKERVLERQKKISSE
mmetsp:Transcript_8524/g.24360  ORF Transcript_8524/g.24360 Transcript_8524/m.24360 type:complete len:219 (+) Transcript_8524:1683-2339(+)